MTRKANRRAMEVENITLRGEIERLRAQVAELQQGKIPREQSLMLAIFDRGPFSVWASDRDCKIVLWSRGAERIYKIPHSEAIGADFVRLFVDKVEADRARGDCAKIVD